MNIIIKQKMSGTGTIYDIESKHYDRVIKMDGYKYAVITSSFYNEPATRHKTMSRAIEKASAKLSAGFTGVTIIDTKNRQYDCFGCSLD